MQHSFSFTIDSVDPSSRARAGTIHTPHGDIQTPAFVPVGTQATIKSLSPEEIQSSGTELFFVNTYHMYLRPGVDVIRAAGGLHAFMGWKGPIITDSGGFQVFSLARKKWTGAQESEDASGSLVRISEDGVTFQSHWDGSSHEFTPESSMDIQNTLGSDIHIAFDDCVEYPATKEKAHAAMERTHRWAVRSLKKHTECRMMNAELGRPYQALYGVVQGSVYEELRQESARYIRALDTDGIAIGGVAVGEGKEDMQHVLSWVTPELPSEKPRHLLGVGEIDDVFALVAAGVDTFDCVAPSRWGRMGHCLVDRRSTSVLPSQIRDTWTYDIAHKAFEKDFGPLVEGCECMVCRTFTRGYIHHLFRVRELLGYRLVTYHNIAFMHALVRQIRLSIQQGSFLDMRDAWLYNRI